MQRLTKFPQTRQNIKSTPLEFLIIQTAGSIFEKLSGDGRYAMVAVTWGGWVRPRWSAASRLYLVKLVIVPNIRNFRDSCLLILVFLAVFASKCICKAQGDGSDVSDN